MLQRFHHIAELDQKFHVPLSTEKMLRLAEICNLHPGTRVLDLGCGKGELLTQWAHHYSIKGTGVDEHADMIEAAQDRANELEVWSEVNFVQESLLDYVQPFHGYNVVVHLASVPVGGTLADTIEYMRPALRTHEMGLLLIGETFWEQHPPQDVFDSIEVEASIVPFLGELSDGLDAANVDLVDMVLADKREMDQYHANQWRTTLNWIHAHSDHPDAADLHTLLRESRSNYLKFEREYLGWGVFVVLVEGTGE